MATATGLALVERHRLAQGEIARTTAAAMLRLFPPLVANGKIDINTPRWLETVLAVLTVQRARSAGIGALYLTAYRSAELGVDSALFTPTPQLEMPTAAFTTSMMVTGPTAYRREVARQLGDDFTPEQLADARLPQGIQQKIAANTARAAMRHVRNGERATTDHLLQNDKAVRGYVRVTSATPCWFCAMLASRGPVYEGDSFADSDPRFHGPGDQKVHDGCGCSLVPIYHQADDGTDWLGQSKAYEALWIKTGNAKDFRAAFEAARP